MPTFLLAGTRCATQHIPDFRLLLDELQSICLSMATSHRPTSPPYLRHQILTLLVPQNNNLNTPLPEIFLTTNERPVLTDHHPCKLVEQTRASTSYPSVSGDRQHNSTTLMPSNLMQSRTKTYHISHGLSVVYIVPPLYAPAGSRPHASNAAVSPCKMGLPFCTRSL